MMKRFLKFFTKSANKRQLQDQSEVDTLYRKYRWQIMTAITVGYGVAYMCRLALSVVKTAYRRRHHVC